MVMSVNGCITDLPHYRLKRDIITRYRVNSGLLAFTGHALEDRVLRDVSRLRGNTCVYIYVYI